MMDLIKPQLGPNVYPTTSVYDVTQNSNDGGPHRLTSPQRFEVPTKTDAPNSNAIMRAESNIEPKNEEIALHPTLGIGRACSQDTIVTGNFSQHGHPSNEFGQLELQP